MSKAGKYIAAVVLTVAAVVTLNPQLIAAAVSADVGLVIDAVTPKQKLTSAGSESQWRADPRAGIPYAVGRCAVAGDKIFERSAPYNTGKYKNVATVYTGAGPIDYWEGFQANDVGVAFTADSGEGASGYYLNRMWLRYQLGGVHENYLHWTATGSKDTPANHGGLPADWTSAHRMSGYAASLWGLEYDTTRYSGGVPSPKAVARWVKVYDPRKDSTYPGGAGTHRYADPSNKAAYLAAAATWEWSANPYLHGLMWCLGRWTGDPSYPDMPLVKTHGLGAPIAMVEVANFVDSANVAQANGWTLGGKVYSTDDKWEVLKLFLEAGGGEPILLGNKIGCMVNAPKVSLATLTKADAVGQVSVAGAVAIEDRLNTIWPSYTEETLNWTVVAFDQPVQVAAYLTPDKGQRSVEMVLPMVQSPVQMAQLARYRIEDSRELTPIVIPAKPHTMWLRPGDCITANEPEWGLNGQKLLIMQRKRDPATMRVTFICRTETDGKHAFALGQTADVPDTPALTAFDGGVVPLPASDAYAIIAGTLAGDNGALPAIVIAGEADFYGAVTIVVDYRQVIDATAGTYGEWQSKPFPASSTNLVVTGVIPGATYQVRLRYITAGGVENPEANTPIGNVVVGEVEGGVSTVWQDKVNDLAARAEETWGALVSEVANRENANGQSDYALTAVRASLGSGSWNADPTFSDWPEGVEPDFPLHVSKFPSDTAGAWEKADGLYGHAVRITSLAGGGDSGGIYWRTSKGQIVAPSASTTQIVPDPAHPPAAMIQVTVEADFTLKTGTLAGATVILQFVTAADGYVSGVAFSLIDEFGAGETGKLYRLRKVVEIAWNSTMAATKLFAVNHHSSTGDSLAVANVIDWHRVEVDPLSGADIQSLAEVRREVAVRVGQYEALAGWQDEATVQLKVNQNLQPNPSGQRGLTGCVTEPTGEANWTTTNAAPMAGTAFLRVYTGINTGLERLLLPAWKASAGAFTVAWGGRGSSAGSYGMSSGYAKVWIKFYSDGAGTVPISGGELGGSDLTTLGLENDRNSFTVTAPAGTGSARVFVENNCVGASGYAELYLYNVKAERGTASTLYRDDATAVVLDATVKDLALATTGPTGSLATRLQTVEAKAKSSPNIARNGDFTRGFEDWPLGGDAYWSIAEDPQMGAYARSTGDNTHSHERKSSWIEINEGQQLGFSFAAKADDVAPTTPLASVFLEFGYVSAPGVVSNVGSPYQFSQSVAINAQSWDTEYRSPLITAPTTAGGAAVNATRARFYIFRPVNNPGIRITRLKLNSGAPTLWSDDATARDVYGKVTDLSQVFIDGSGNVKVIRALQTEVGVGGVVKVSGIVNVNDGTVSALILSGDEIYLENPGYPAFKLVGGVPYVGDDRVRTDSIVQGSVTPTIYAFDATTVYGSTTPTVVFSQTVDIPYDCTIDVTAALSMRFTSGDKTHNVELLIDGVSQFPAGGARSTNAYCVTGQRVIYADPNPAILKQISVQIVLTAQDSTVRIVEKNFNIKRIQR